MHPLYGLTYPVSMRGPRAEALKWKETDGPALSGPMKSDSFGIMISNHSVRALFWGTLFKNGS
jgi:hypothetical protein